MNISLDQARDGEWYRCILDAIPAPVFVLNESLRMVDYNAFAARMVGEEKGTVLRRKSGEVLFCVHSKEQVEGCGHSGSCPDCVVRNSALAALGGRKVSRQKARMELEDAGKVQEIELLVTAVSFTHASGRLVLLMLENLSEWITTRSTIPICAQCKKVRDDHASWHGLEEYVTAYMYADLSHSLCPHCASELYPDIFPDPTHISRLV